MAYLKNCFSRFIQFILVLLVLPFPVLAQNMTANAAPAYLGSLNSIFASLTRALIGLVGIASFVMLLMGGFRFISAGSDKDSAQKAQQTINYAIGGLIISLSAWLLLSLIGTFLGVPVGLFDICITANC